MPIYTKKGDRGETSLFSDKYGTKRVSKDSVRIRAIGSVDELNSLLGMIISFSENEELNNNLLVIQKNIFTIGSILAGSELKFSKANTAKLEKQIDEIDKIIKSLSNFILPGGTKTASMLHVARSVSRRAEREIVALSQIEEVLPSIIKYINRLSDYFFTLARYSNHLSRIEEKLWEYKQ